MPIQHESPAIAIARAHAEAWANHDFDAARRSLAANVTATATTTKPTTPDTNLAGIDDYMHGPIQFAQAVVPGSLRVIASIGDDRNALLMVTVEAEHGGGKVTLPAARLYLPGENHKIKAAQVIFCAAAD